MHRAILIIGLPGSGKTFLIKEKFSNGDYVVIDDPKDSLLISDMISVGRDLVIADAHLCDKLVRNSALCSLSAAGYEVSEIFFDNDPEKCKANIAFRNDGRVIKDLTTFHYTIPPHAKERTRKIWQNE